MPGTGSKLVMPDVLGTLYWQLLSSKLTKRENSGRFTNQVSIYNVYCQIALNMYHSWRVGHMYMVVLIWQSQPCSACLKHPVELFEMSH